VTVAGKKRGIFADAGLTDKVADFSYESDSLAELIVEAWTDQNFTNDLTTGTQAAREANAKAAFAARGIFLQKPIVITEDEYDAGYHVPDPTKGIVFVLPRQTRTDAPPAHQSLLETAKFLMAFVPNGI
jgi:hypothetical protein